ncbi:MAG: hypothetical protein ACXV8A_00210 [Chthoniobacterales bacterium]
MAKKYRPEKSIAEIRQEIAHSRDRMARDLTGLRDELDFPLKFRKSFQRNTAIWISAAILTGVVLTARLTTRKRTLRLKTADGGRKKGEEQRKGLVEAGLVAGAFKLAATLLRPVVIGYVKKKVGSYAGRIR